MRCKVEDKGLLGEFGCLFCFYFEVGVVLDKEGEFFDLVVIFSIFIFRVVGLKLFIIILVIRIV